MKKSLFVCLIALFAWSSGFAQKPAIVMGNDEGWQRIGETEASFREQDESIIVMGSDEFAAIKFRVEEAPLEIERMQVFYHSGEMEEIDVSKKIDAGEESDVFELEHPNSEIQKVAFTYNTAANQAGEKADVVLFGYRVEDEREGSSAWRDNEDDAKREERKAEREAEREAREAERDAERAARDVDRETDQAARSVERGAERTESDVERSADDAGDAIAEAAATVAAEVDDPRHDTKVGPDGQTIYISDDERYYYIDDEGKRRFVTEIQLKDKPQK